MAVRERYDRIAAERLHGMAKRSRVVVVIVVVGDFQTPRKHDVVRYRDAARLALTRPSSSMLGQ